jgi:hypothetical protein
MRHTTVKFDITYISLSLFIISLFSLYALMNKYSLKNGAVKWNSGPKDTDTDLLTGTQTCISLCAITGIEGTCWSLSIWCQKPLHPQTPQKNVMDPWPAPYQNSNDYWCSAYGQKTSRSNFIQTSGIFAVSTQVLQQRTFLGRGTTDKSEVLLPLSSNATCFIRWRINWLSQLCIFTPVDRQKQVPTLLHITIYVIKTGFIPCHSLLYNTKGKFYNSCTTEPEHDNLIIT